MLATLFFRRPRLTATLLLVIAASGLSAFLTVGRQEDPTITNLFATVVTPFPGADAARVEALVSDPIEDALAAIPEIDEIRSTSRAGVSLVTVELSAFIDAGTIDEAWSQIRDALGEVAGRLPRGAAEPAFDNDRTGAYTAIAALVPAAPHVPPAVTARLAESLRDRLRQLPGTERTSVFGAPEEEVRVEADPLALAALGLSADRLAATIASADPKESAGRLRSPALDAVVEVEGEIDGLARIAEIPLASGPDGTVSRVGDVAMLAKTERDPPTEIAYANGETAVLVAARMEPDRQVDRYMARVREEIAAFEAGLPDGVRLALLFDQSRYTESRLAEVAGNMALGVALVLAVLFVTLGLRAALAVALVLPATLLASLATLGVLGVSIHQMSVTGLIVALGLLVDAAIVMVDEIRKRLSAGLSPREAVGGSVERLAGPLLASTLTTALAFTPMALLPGPAGDFVGAIAIAVIVMLFWSFALALTVTPALAGWLLGGAAGARAGFLSRGIGAGAAGRAFLALVRLSLSRPRLSILYALVLPVAGFLSFPTLTAQFFPGVDRDQFFVEIEMPPGTGIRGTEAAALAADRAIRAGEGVRQVAWVIGRAAPAFYYNMRNDRDGSQDYAKALVTTASPEATARLVTALQDRLDDALPAARVVVRDLVQGPPVDAPVELRFVGPDLAVLKTLGEEARTIVAALPEVTMARTVLGDSPPKLAFRLDEEKVRAAGLTLDGVARQLDAALEGALGGTFVEASEELPVRVRLAGAVRDDPAALSTLLLVPERAAAGADGPPAFGAIPLAALGTLEVVPADAVIARRNGERTNTVQAFVRYGVLPQEALETVRAALAREGFAVPPGYRLEVGGDADARGETISNLMSSMGFVVTLTVATIVLAFNSFRLALVAGIVCGLSAGLSLLALAVFQYPFGINAVIGVIGSIGVSINAAIIVMTALQADPRAAAGDREAMAAVVAGAGRHIFSTTLTTVGGFLPLILAGGGFWPPFAMAIAGGVALSAVVSFFFTPPVFALVYAGRRARARTSPAATVPRAA